MSSLGPQPYKPAEVDERHTNPSGLPEGDPKKVAETVPDEHHEPEVEV